MKKLFVYLSGLVLLSCNPYEQHKSTHLYIQAEVDPGTGFLSSNVQMVFVAGKEYADSICFLLNPGFEIRSLAAQELEYYLFNETGSGMLVLYLEEQLNEGESLQIALSYSGKLAQHPIQRLDSATCWLPVNEDTQPCTYMAKLALPGKWRVAGPDARTGQHGKWLIEARDAREFPVITFTLEWIPCFCDNYIFLHLVLIPNEKILYHIHSGCSIARNNHCTLFLP